MATKNNKSATEDGVNDNDEGYFAGPQVKWTIQDYIVENSPNKEATMIYHVVLTPIGFLSPFGALLGAGASLLGLSSIRKPPTSMVAAMGTGALATSTLGATIGLAGLYQIKKQGEKASPPWNNDGLDDRIYRLQHNFKVRVIDVSTWCGIGLAATTLMLVARGHPSTLRLSSNRLVGTLQLLSLGAAAGGSSGLACIASSYKSTE